MNYEIDFLPVGEGNADAIVVCHDTGLISRTLYVVDGGYTSTAQTIISHIETYYGKEAIIDHMVLSHADDDHAAGLVDVLKHFTVRNIWMNCPWEYVAEAKNHFHANFSVEGLIAETRKRHPHLVALEGEAKKKPGTVIHEAFQGAQIGQFQVLAPSCDRYLQLLPDFDRTPDSYAKADSATSIFDSVVETAKSVASKIFETFGFETLDENPPDTGASNESSVVLLGNIDGANPVLTGDAGPQALTEAADFAESLGLLKSPTFIQIPHHGSRRNVTPAVLDRWLGAKLSDNSVRRGSAFVSVGTGENAKRYPRAKVKNAFIRRGYSVFATRGGPKSHYRGTGHGWGAATPEAFSPDVDV